MKNIIHIFGESDLETRHIVIVIVNKDIVAIFHLHTTVCLSKISSFLIILCTHWPRCRVEEYLVISTIHYTLLKCDSYHFKTYIEYLKLSSSKLSSSEENNQI